MQTANTETLIPTSAIPPDAVWVTLLAENTVAIETPDKLMLLRLPDRQGQPPQELGVFDR